jgi:hypothetical protein
MSIAEGIFEEFLTKLREKGVSESLIEGIERLLASEDPFTQEDLLNLIIQEGEDVGENQDNTD